MPLHSKWIRKSALGTGCCCRGLATHLFLSALAPASCSLTPGQTAAGLASPLQPTVAASCCCMRQKSASPHAHFRAPPCTKSRGESPPRGLSSTSPTGTTGKQKGGHQTFTAFSHSPGLCGLLMLLDTVDCELVASMSGDCRSSSRRLVALDYMRSPAGRHNSTGHREIAVIERTVRSRRAPRVATAPAGDKAGHSGRR